MKHRPWSLLLATSQSWVLDPGDDNPRAHQLPAPPSPVIEVQHLASCRAGRCQCQVPAGVPAYTEDDRTNQRGAVVALASRHDDSWARVALR